MNYNSIQDVQSAYDAILIEVQENMVSIQDGMNFQVQAPRGQVITGQPRDLAETVLMQLLDTVLQGVR